MASYLGYIRVSDVAGRNGDGFISPAVQRETIERLAAAKGFELAGIVEELDVSGGKKIEERKLGELVHRIERGECAGLIVWKLSRFSRSLSDCATVAERIMESGGHLLADDFDSRAGSAHTLLGVLAGLAHDQRLERKAGWAEAQKRAIQRGAATHKTPYGYQRNGDGSLHPHPEQAETVRLIFKLKGEGKQLSAIERALDGTPSPSGGVKWSHSTLRQVVTNRVYLGELRHGDYVNREAHEALIDATTFELAQAVKPRRELKRGKLPRSAESISASLARCAACGHTLKVIPGYRGRLTLYCKPESYAVPCTERAYVRADELDPYLESWFLKAIAGRRIAVEAVEAREGLQEAQQDVEAAEHALQAFAGASEILDSAIFQSALETRNRQLTEARQKLSDLRAQSASLGSLPTGDLDALWPSFSPVEKRELIGALVESIFVKKGREPIAERVRVEQV